MNDTPKRDLRSKRHYQYSLRWLFISVTLVSVVLGWFAWYLRPRLEYHSVAARIRQAGGRLPDFDDHPNHGAKGIRAVILRGGATDADMEQLLNELRGLTGLEYLSLGGSQVTDAGLAHLGKVKGVRRLHLGETRITDAGLEQLRSLDNLEWLVLSSNKITDMGLVHLKALTNLRELDLIDTRVSDAGVEHLKALSSLERLELDSTHVTQEGIEDIQQALPDCVINSTTHVWPHVINAEFTTAAPIRELGGSVAYCGKVGAITKVDLARIPLTDADLGGLKTSLESLPITSLDLEGTQLTDAGLQHLKGLTKLEMLHLNDTQVTVEGVKELQQTLPNCEIEH